MLLFLRILLSWYHSNTGDLIDMKGHFKPVLFLIFLLSCIQYMYFSKSNLIYTTDDRDKDTSFVVYGNWPRPRPVFSESKIEQQHGFIEKAQTVEYKNSIPAEPGRPMVTEYEVDDFIENVGLLINESRQETSLLSMFVHNQDEHLQNSIQITKDEAISRTINKFMNHDDDLKYEDEIKDVRRENIPDGLVQTWNERNISKTIETLAAVLLDVIPSSFEKNIRNPCWYDDRGLRCLPYFYLAGMPKCGTTDVWEKISAHPDVVSCRKEPHWWTRTRFVGNMENNVSKYLARQRPLARRLTNSSEAQSKAAIIGDGSASTFWDFRIWSKLFPTESEAPRETNAHLIHTIQPDARIIVVLRNPTDRLYSDYYYFNYGKHTSPTMFHRCSIEAIEIFNRCLQDHDLRTCTYSIIYKYYRPTKETDIGPALNVHRETTMTECPKLINRLIIGLYDVFAQDWLDVFPRDQLLFMTTKDWNSDCVEYLQQIYMFLGLDKQSDDERRKVCQTKHANTSRKKPPILDESRKLLDEFYRPHMRRLSNLLNDTKYSWNL